MTPYLSDADAETRGRAVDVLFMLSPATLSAATHDRLEAMLNSDPSLRVRAGIIITMSTYAPASPLLRPAVLAAFDHQNMFMRYAAIRAVGQARLLDDADRLLGPLRGEDARLREAAAEALGQGEDRSERFLPDLEYAAEHDDNPTVRHAARAAVARVRKTGSVRPGLGDPDVSSSHGGGGEGGDRGRLLYARHCQTCHGVNGEGGGAERANALGSESFRATADYRFVSYAIQFGRPGTAMAAFDRSMGGPLESDDISELTRFILAPASRRRHESRRAPPDGDATAGRAVYRSHCVTCHGVSGEGVTAPGLRSPTFLYTVRKPFLYDAVAYGRTGTAMPAFEKVLNDKERSDVVAYIWSWRADWIPPSRRSLIRTSVKDFILSPQGAPARFARLRDSTYVTARDLWSALQSKARLVLLDVRAGSAWAESHIPGAISFPYYDVEWRDAEIPRDGTWVVAYCECPTHLAEEVVAWLRMNGLATSAVLDGGLGAWIGSGYPLARDHSDSQHK